MKLEGYTTEVFLENLKKDSEIFGEETAIAIYEEIFSDLSGKKIKLGGILNKIRTLEEEIYNEEMIEEASRREELRAGIAAASKALEAASKAKTAEQAAKIGWQGADAWATASSDVLARSAEAAERAAILKTGWQGADAWSLPARSAAAEQAVATAAEAGAGAAKFSLSQLFGRVGNFLKKLPERVSNFFGGLKGKSFSEILSQGAGWLKANPMLALKTTGGIALLFMIIRALKKRGELNRYRTLAAIEAKSNMLKEDCYDTIIEDTKEKIAMRKVLEECKTNKALAKVILG